MDTDKKEPFVTPDHLIEADGSGLEFWPGGDRSKATTFVSLKESFTEQDAEEWEDTDE